MNSYWWCAILFRVLIPAVVASAAFIRPTITSYAYMALGCYMPFFSVPTIKTMAGATGTFMRFFVVICTLICSIVLSFYFALFFSNDPDYQLEPCSPLEITIRTLGIIQYANLPLMDALTWCIPEPLMLLTASCSYWCFKKLNHPPGGFETAQADVHICDLKRKKTLHILRYFGPYFTCGLFCLTAVLEAGAFGFIYYLVFMGTVTCWAYNLRLERTFARVLVGVIPILYTHVTVLLFYQFQYFQDDPQFEPKSLWGRLFNLVDIKTYKDCKDPRLFILHPKSSTIYILLVCIFIIYHVSILYARQLLEAEDGVFNLVAATFRCSNKDASMKWRRIIKKIKEDIEEKKTNSALDKLRSFIDYIFEFIYGLSFLLANCAMMIWAVAYVGPTSMALLIWSNIICLVPFRRKVMMGMSFILVLFFMYLLTVNYIYAIDLTEEEMPSHLYFRSGISHDKIRDRKGELLIKFLLALFVFIFVRKLWHKTSLRNQELRIAESLGESYSKATSSENKFRFTLVERFQKKSLAFFSECWIWIVIIVMVWLEFWNNSTIFKITYVCLALICIMTFQLCPFNYWKKFLDVYWWIVIIYAMFNLIMLYAYQIKPIRTLFFKYVPEQESESLGFRFLKNTKERFLTLLHPLCLELATLIQQKYFQSEFNKNTASSSPETQPDQDLTKNNSSIWTFAKEAVDTLLAIAEIHLPTILLLLGWFMCFYDFCAILAPVVLLLTAGCILGRTFTRMVIYFSSVVVQILIVLRLVYMNQYLDHQKWNYIGYYERNGKANNITLNSADWIGFHESRLGRNYADFRQLAWCFIFVLVVTIHRLVTIRMNIYRVSKNLPQRKDIVFPEITFENYHDSVTSMLKYFVNYGFYKFGCEITFIFAALVMALRVDAAALGLSFFLLLCLLPRVWIRRMWPVFLIAIIIGVPLEYLATLGFWPTFFERSLSKFWCSTDFRLRIQQFCSLLNMVYPPAKSKFLLDFFLLMAMSKQWLVFRKELRLKNGYDPAGSNESVAYLIDKPSIKNPIPDFISYAASHLDIYKYIFFNTWFFIALIFTFLAGVMKTTIFSFGYIIGSFAFLWEGTDLFLRPAEKILRKWNYLIAYNIFVMMARIVTEIFGCILKYEESTSISCHLFRLLSIGCIGKHVMIDKDPNVMTKSTCEVADNSLGLTWDCICFCCLICQKRIFQSFHFIHIVNDAKAHATLADRGAGLIEENRRKKREAIDSKKEFIEKSIKKKLERIEANRDKIDAIRAGDYRNFDEVERDLDIPLLPPEDEEDDEYDSYDPMPFTEFLGLFFTTNIDTVLEINMMRRRRKKMLGKKVTGKKELDASKTASIPRSKIQKIIIFLFGIFESIIVSIAALLNRDTRELRAILRRIEEDKRILKEKTDYTQGVRLGVKKMWHPVQSYRDILNAEDQKQHTSSKIEISIYFKLLRAIWYVFMKHSEWICYLSAIINVTMRSNFITLPMVLMIFLWGALTIPRPTNAFWIISIAYILIMVFVKCGFNMGFAPWSDYSHEDNVFFPPYFLGVRNTKKLLTYFWLFILCFHRVVLHRLGLWKPIIYRSSSLMKDGMYVLENGQLLPAEANKRNKLELKTNEVSIGDYFPKSVLHGAMKYAEASFLYVQQLINPISTQVPVDVYTPMFLCDLVNMFLLIFFFGKLQNDPDYTGLLDFIFSNRVPLTYIIIMLIYFFLMMIDRGLYLRRNRFGKLIYHFSQVIFYHIAYVIIYPFATNKKPHWVPTLQIFYIFKCFYFLFSAYQIKNGYPILISYHFLWHKTTMINRFAYKCYRSIPYFLEIRCLLDWICTDSCLGIPGWFKMEDVTQCLFSQRCMQEFNSKYDSPSGQKKKRVRKNIVGGSLYMLLVFTVIFPFLLFSLSSTMGVTTSPLNLKMHLYMGGTESFYKSYVDDDNIIRFSEEDYNNLTMTFNVIKDAHTIFNSFEPSDVMAIKLFPDSFSTWPISPGSRQELVEKLEGDQHMIFTMELSYLHIGNGGKKTDNMLRQSISFPPLPNIQRKKLIDMIKLQAATNSSFCLPLILPKFVMITKESEAVVLPIMKDPVTTRSELDDASFEENGDTPVTTRRLRNILIQLRLGQENWWKIREECSIDDDNYSYYLKNLVHNSCENIVIYIFNEKCFSNTMKYITQGGILGLYLLYFMMVIEVIRSFRVKITDIWIKNLPNSKRLYRKCMEIYVARDMKNYKLEREIFDEIICIMRSRELIIKLSRFEDNNYDPTFIIPGS